MEWAAENNIVLGDGNGNFTPNEMITREQMCAMIVRYLIFAGVEMPELTAASTFDDESLISAWAKGHVKATQMADLIQGEGGRFFNPQGNATRAQVATILMRLIENILEK